MLLWRLFIACLKLGAFTFGGGYSMVPLMQREFVENRHWIGEEDIANLFALAQSLPGGIAINAAAFVGYRVAKTPGAIAATLGVVLPSLILLSALTLVYVQFRENPYLQKALRGINAVVIALMLSAMIRMGKASLKSPLLWAAGIAALVLGFGFKVPAQYLILGGAGIGVVIAAAMGKGRSPEA